MGDRGKLAAIYGFIGIRLNNLDNRKILQKKIYFIQEFGFNLGYDFGFYIYGPYSTDLTSDVFRLQEQFEVARNTVFLDDLTAEEQRALGYLDELLQGIPEENLAHQLELLSSIHFLNNHIYQPIPNLRLMIQEIERRKPGRFSIREIRRAWTRLNQLELLTVEEE